MLDINHRYRQKISTIDVYSRYLLSNIEPDVAWRKDTTILWCYPHKHHNININLSFPAAIHHKFVVLRSQTVHHNLMVSLWCILHIYIYDVVVVVLSP